MIIGINILKMCWASAFIHLKTEHYANIANQKQLWAKLPLLILNPTGHICLY